MKMKTKLAGARILLLILAWYIWTKKYYIVNIPNYYELLTSFQDFSMFLSGVLLTLFGISSFLPNNHFIKKLKDLNVDLLITSKLFNLSLVSIIVSAMPLFLKFFDKQDKSEMGRVVIIVVFLFVSMFFVEICILIKQLKKILEEVIAKERSQRNDVIVK